jgi:hypothetical protein
MAAASRPATARDAGKDEPLFLAQEPQAGGRPPASAVGFVLAALLSYGAYASLGALIGVATSHETAATLLAQLGQPDPVAHFCRMTTDVVTLEPDGSRTPADVYDL